MFPASLEASGLEKQEEKQIANNEKDLVRKDEVDSLHSHLASSVPLHPHLGVIIPLLVPTL